MTFSFEKWGTENDFRNHLVFQLADVIGFPKEDSGSDNAMLRPIILWDPAVGQFFPQVADP